MTLTVGSCFAGIGGIDLGLDAVGMDIRWQIEKDEYCRSVLAKRFPGVPCYGDIEEVDVDELEKVDVVAGGFPCTDLSVAGRREGIGGKGSGLWVSMLRVIRAVKPEWVVVENVPGLLSAVDVRGERGGAMGTVLRDLAESGFDAWWDRISARSLGALHRRERIFLVAKSNGSPVKADYVADAH